MTVPPFACFSCCCLSALDAAHAHIASAQGDQLGVGATLGNAAFFDHQNLIRIADGGQAVYAASC